MTSRSTASLRRPCRVERSGRRLAAAARRAVSDGAAVTQIGRIHCAASAADAAVHRLQIARTAIIVIEPDPAEIDAGSSTVPRTRS